MKKFITKLKSFFSTKFKKLSNKKGYEDYRDKKRKLFDKIEESNKLAGLESSYNLNVLRLQKCLQLIDNSSDEPVKLAMKMLFNYVNRKDDYCSHLNIIMKALNEFSESELKKLKNEYLPNRYMEHLFNDDVAPDSRLLDKVGSGRKTKVGLDYKL